LTQTQMILPGAEIEMERGMMLLHEHWAMRMIFFGFSLMTSLPGKRTK
jgi:hypothetical protein